MENELIHDLVDAQRGILGLLQQYQTAFASLHSWQTHVQNLLSTLVTALVENEPADFPRPALDTAEKARAEIAELEKLFKREQEPEA